MRATPHENCRRISPRRARLSLVIAPLLALAAFFAACDSSKQGDKPRGLVVVNATATGTVRRVLSSEGASIGENGVLLEIVQEPAGGPAPQAKPGNPQSSAQAANALAQRDVQSAQDEVQRAAVEIERVRALVSGGAASQAELDAAQAAYQHAQEKLQRAKDAAASAERNFVVEQGNPQPQSTAKPAEQVVVVRAPSAGVVRVISVRAGQPVTAGQAIATIASDKR